MSKAWFCYIARCIDQSFYVGIATDLAEREKEHNWGVGAAFTAKRRPVKIIWCEEFATQEEARRREVELKGWSRRKKLELVEGRGLRRGKPFASPCAAQGKGE